MLTPEELQGYRYQEYGPDESLYMRLTKTWALRFRETLTNRLARESRQKTKMSSMSILARNVKLEC